MLLPLFTFFTNTLRYEISQIRYKDPAPKSWSNKVDYYTYTFGPVLLVFIVPFVLLAYYILKALLSPFKYLLTLIDNEYKVIDQQIAEAKPLLAELKALIKKSSNR